MEQTTGGLNLSITTADTIEADDIKNTIVKYSENFVSLEKYLKSSASSPSLIPVAVSIERGKIVWNSTPSVGSHVGWVNIRDGQLVNPWEPKQDYSLGDKVKPPTDNGNVYECIIAGRSMVKTPTFLIGNGVEFYDANGGVWMSNFNYQVNDVVFSTDGSKNFYYICETAGYSSLTEPTWNTTPSGSTLIDGSVVWRKEQTVRWRQSGGSAEFRPFGKIE